MKGEYTGLFQTQDEGQARRVLSSLRTPDGQPCEFIYKEGWYQIIAPGLLAPEDAASMNRYAHTLANVSLKPQPLSAFKQSQL